MNIAARVGGLLGVILTIYAIVMIITGQDSQWKTIKDTV